MTTRSIVLLSLLAAPLASANDEAWQVHVGVSWVRGLRIAAAAPSSADPSLAPMTDRTYDDGFNRVDATGNIGDGPDGPLASRTGYFAFERDDQVDLAAGTLTLSTLSQAEGDAGALRRAADTGGLSIDLRRDLRPAGATWHWGIQLGADWHGRESTVRSYDESATVRRLFDSYRLGGVVPQQAPYTGHFTPQPGDQRIGDTPERTILEVDGRRVGSQHIEQEFTLARAGLWIEGRVTPWLALHAHAGAARGWIDASVSTADVLSVLDGLSTSRNFDNTGSVNPWGWYAGAGFRVRLSARLQLAGQWSGVDLGDAREGRLSVDAGSLGLTQVRLGWSF